MEKYGSMMAKVIAENDRDNEWRGKSGWVKPKKGVVVKRICGAPGWISGEVTLRGKLYSVLPNIILPLRTMFLKEPIAINGERFYMEVKGYGYAGGHLNFQNHVSGDIFYGMYLENALREFDRMTLARCMGLPVAFPLAVVEIPRDEYIKKGLEGFQERLKAELSFNGMLDLVRVEELTGEIDLDEYDPDAISRKLMNYISRKYEDDVIEGIKFIIKELDRHPGKSYGIGDAADALTSGKKVGYLIRGSRCPIRIGDPSDKNIDRPEFRMIARSMGHAFRSLLEIGIVHHCPGTGNWTVAGELTDFSDTFDLNLERDLLESHIDELVRMKSIGVGSMSEFVKYLIGPDHTGLLCPYFLEGLFGERITIDRAVERLLKYF